MLQRTCLILSRECDGDVLLAISHQCTHEARKTVFTLHSQFCNRFTTGCINTAGCTTGWVNYANEPSQAALERFSQDADDVIRLTRSKAAVWTVDDVAL